VCVDIRRQRDFAVALQQAFHRRRRVALAGKADHPAAAWPVHPDDLHGQRRLILGFELQDLGLP